MSVPGFYTCSPSVLPAISSNTSHPPFLSPVMDLSPVTHPSCCPPPAHLCIHPLSISSQCIYGLISIYLSSSIYLYLYPSVTCPSSVIHLSTSLLLHHLSTCPPAVCPPTIMTCLSSASGLIASAYLPSSTCSRPPCPLSCIYPPTHTLHHHGPFYHLCVHIGPI